MLCLKKSCFRMCQEEAEQLLPMAMEQVNTMMEQLEHMIDGDPMSTNVDGVEYLTTESELEYRQMQEQQEKVKQHIAKHEEMMPTLEKELSTAVEGTQAMCEQARILQTIHCDGLPRVFLRVLCIASMLLLQLDVMPDAR